MYIRTSGDTVEVLSPAKVNLYLAVRGKRDDGYHELETLVMAVGLYDTLRFSARPEGPIRLACRWAWGYTARARASQLRRAGGEPLPAEIDPIPEGEHNLVYRAAALVRARAGLTRGAQIELIKRIPAAAGLGGGSSDAAATLLAANQAWGLGWSRRQLAKLAAELGSDVPFFLTGDAARCRGRGEQIQRCRLPAVPLVVVRPPCGLSTAAVFARCRPGSAPVPHEAWLHRAARGDWGALRDQWRNDLAPAAASLSEWISRVGHALGQQDLWGHQMTGSGSSWFGIGRSARQAVRVAARLRAQGLGWVFATTRAPPMPS
jgi:4-diphosphocytidyl-2-C-methyl-D-erythritol kinase